MKKSRRKPKRKPHGAIHASTIICCITFITNVIHAIKDGNIDNAVFNQLLASANGFETVVLFIVMLVLKNKKK